jgi:hypothetical protein
MKIKVYFHYSNKDTFYKKHNQIFLKLFNHPVNLKVHGNNHQML